MSINFTKTDSSIEIHFAKIYSKETASTSCASGNGTSRQVVGRFSSARAYYHFGGFNTSSRFSASRVAHGRRIQGSHNPSSSYVSLSLSLRSIRLLLFEFSNARKIFFMHSHCIGLCSANMFNIKGYANNF